MARNYHLAFVDDIDAVAHNTRDVRDIFSSSEFHAQRMGTEDQKAKTEYILISRNTRQKVRQNITVNNYNYNEVVKSSNI